MAVDRGGSSSGAWESPEAAAALDEVEPRCAYGCHVAGRVLVAVLTALALALACAVQGVVLARFTIEGVAEYNTRGFNVFLWRLEMLQEGPPPYIWFTDEKVWVNGTARVCMATALVLLAAATATSVVFAGCLCYNQRQRRRVATTRRAAVAHDARASEAHALEMARRHQRRGGEEVQSGGGGGSDCTGEMSPVEGAAEDDDAAAPKPTAQPTAHYVELEERRRRVDFGVGVALFALLVVSAVLCLVGIVSCATYFSDGGLVRDLRENLRAGDDAVPYDVVRMYAKAHFKGGLWLILGPLLAAAGAVVLLVVPPLSGLWMCGPRAVVPQPQRRRPSEGDSVEMAERHRPATGAVREAPPLFAVPSPGTKGRAMHGIPVALPGPPMEEIDRDPDLQPRDPPARYISNSVDKNNG